MTYLRRKTILFGSSVVTASLFFTKSNKPTKTYPEWPGTPLTSGQIEQVFHRNLVTFVPSIPHVVSHSSFNSIASNSPCEDMHSEHLLKAKQGILLGVFDGHSGLECSTLLSEYLSAYVSKAILNIPPTVLKEERPQHVKKAMVQAFESLDRDLLNG